MRFSTLRRSRRRRSDLEPWQLGQALRPARRRPAIRVRSAQITGGTLHHVSTAFKGGDVTPHRGVGRAGQCVAGRAGGCRPSIAPGRARKCSRPRSAPTLPKGAKGSTASPRRPVPGFEGATSLASPAVIPWVRWLVSHNHADSRVICMTGSRGRPGLLSARRGERSEPERAVGDGTQGEGMAVPAPAKGGVLGLADGVDLDLDRDPCPVVD